MRETLADLRHAARRLRNTPGFCLGAVAVLACGIGANVTIFTALHAAVLAGPPYPDAERLVLPAVSVPRPGEPGVRLESWSYPRFQLYREQHDRLVHPVAAYALSRPTLAGVGDPARIDAEIVSPDCFALLGVTPILGRTFAHDESDPSAPPEVVVLGHGLWQARFAGDPSVLGRRVLVDGSEVSVVGVLPAGFEGLTGRGELWLPMAAAGRVLGRWRVDDPHVYWFHVLGRLRVGVTRERAEAQMALIADRIEEAFPDPEAPRDAHRGVVRPLRGAMVNDTTRLSIQIMAAAAALVLLVACANLAGLLLARFEAQRRATAVRLAMGAGRWRIIRQALAESLLLALAGGLGGVAVARWGTGGLLALAPEAFARGSARLEYLDLESLGLDASALLFALGLSGATSLLFGLAPGWRMSKLNLAASLKRGVGASGAFSGAELLFGRCLVGAQVALALVLLVGSGLMIASLTRLNRVETGVEEARSLLTFTYSAPQRTPSSTFLPDLEAAGTAEDPATFHSRFLERLRSLPGVRAATLGCPPLGGICAQTAVRQVGNGPPIPREERTVVIADVVEESFFRTVGARLLAGRGLTEADGAGRAPVVVLNEAAARALFPDQDPLGRRIGFALGPAPEGETAEVVGVVRDILYEGPEVGTQPAVYASFRQVPLAEASVVVRAAGDPFGLLPSIRRELRRLDPTLPVFGVDTIEALGVRATGTQRMIMSLLAVFAALTLALSGVGVYGAAAYAVSLRHREIGIRMALGARPRQVLRLVLGQGLVAAAAGIVAGLAMALASSRVLASLLFGVTAHDPATHAAGAAVSLAVAALGCALPARAATRVDPAAALEAD